MNRILLATIVALALLLTSCGGGGSSTPPPPPPVFLLITESSFPFGVVGQPYAGAQLTVSGGTAPYTWSASSVPAGMAFSTGGKLTGDTPGPSEGLYAIKVSVRDSAGNSGDKVLTLRTYSPLSASLSNKEMTSGVPYTGWLIIAMNQSTLTATAKLVSGSLPPGLAFGTATTQGPNPLVQITGTPTQKGIFDFTVEVSDSLTPPRVSQVPLKMFVDVRELVFYVSETLVDAKRTEAYQISLWVGGGTAPITCSLAPGSTPLPGGLTVGSDCVLSGTPTTNGQFSFTVQARDSGIPQQTTSKTLNLKVVEPLKIADLPDATAGQIYSTTLQITGGTPPYYYSQNSASTCCIVLEKNNNTLHGVPYDSGKQYVYLSVRDSEGQTIYPMLGFNVLQGSFGLATDSLPRMKVGTYYQSNLSSVSGNRPITWVVESGSLPPGITFLGSNYYDNALLYGTPSAAGTYPITLSATDSSTPPQIAHIPIALQVYSKLHRDESVLTSDFLASGQGHSGYNSRSISPFADPADLANPDQDYYHLRAFAGETISIQVNRLLTMDPAMEIVDSNGQRFSTCRDPSDDTPDADGNVDLTPLAFDDACRNDDIDAGVNVNSQLYFLVPGASGTIVDFYVHVVDFRGDARPDFLYDIHLYHERGMID